MKQLHHRCKVQNRAAYTVQLVHDDPPDLSFADLAQQLLKLRSVRILTGIAFVLKYPAAPAFQFILAKVNPKLTAYDVELAQVEAEIEMLLDTLTGANATLLAYANKKIEELDTRRQTISKAIAELSVETISPQQIKKLSYYLDNWDSIDFDDKRKAADGLISTIKATSDRVQIEWKI